MVYRDRLVKWIHDAERGGEMPTGSASLFASSNASDKELYASAQSLFHSYEKKKKTGDDEMLFLVPRTDKDGGFHFYNRETGQVEASVERQSNGLFSFHGPRKYLIMLGGRGEFGEISKKLNDGNYFQD